MKHFLIGILSVWTATVIAAPKLDDPLWQLTRDWCKSVNVSVEEGGTKFMPAIGISLPIMTYPSGRPKLFLSAKQALLPSAGAGSAQAVDVRVEMFDEDGALTWVFGPDTSREPGVTTNVFDSASMQLTSRGPVRIQQKGTASYLSGTDLTMDLNTRNANLLADVEMRIDWRETKRQRSQKELLPQSIINATRMEYDYAAGRVVLDENVKVNDQAFDMSATRAIVDTDNSNDFRELTLQGKVRAVGKNDYTGKSADCSRAIYSSAENLLTLFGSPAILRDGENELHGKTIRAWSEEKRAVFEDGTIVYKTKPLGKRKKVGGELQTLRVTANAMEYDFNASMAQLRGNVKAKSPDYEACADYFVAALANTNELRVAQATGKVKIDYPPYTVRANSASYTNASQTATFVGNVTAVGDGRKVAADIAIYKATDENSAKIDLRGNASMSDEERSIEADEITTWTTRSANVKRENEKSENIVERMFAENSVTRDKPVTMKVFGKDKKGTKSTTIIYGGNVKYDYETSKIKVSSTKLHPQVRADCSNMIITANEFEVLLRDDNTLEEVRASGNVFITNETGWVASRFATYKALDNKTIKTPGMGEFTATGRITVRGGFDNTRNAHFEYTQPGTGVFKEERDEITIYHDKENRFRLHRDEAEKKSAATEKTDREDKSFSLENGAENGRNGQIHFRLDLDESAQEKLHVPKADAPETSGNK